MKKVKISYNPYKMITTVLIDGVDVCKAGHYDKFREFIKSEIPLQTWIEPIPYMDWAGFVNEISDPEINDEVTVAFSGRTVDFEDLKRSIEKQNKERLYPVGYHYKYKKVWDDKELSANIEDVIKALKSARFQALVDQRTSGALLEKYNKLDENYKIAKESIFYIVFAGVYSSGKSTLLNTLMRHDVLPTSAQTCTSKNCRIKHECSFGKNLSLVCYDEDENVVIEKRIFDNDADCANAFLEICPIKNGNSEDKYPKVSTMELGVDLSHLYPDSVNDEAFTIVLMDTPGMDSAQSSKDGMNRHEKIALDAISMKNKPMIILCVDGQKYEDISIGEFMCEIIEQTKEEGSGFNDRFLFLMNKSDMITYKHNEMPDNIKNAFSEYLTDASKWNIKGDEEELRQLAEDASHFVPRVFMTAAAPALAITSRLPLHPKQDDEIDDDHWPLIKAYRAFRDEVMGTRHPEKYYLSKYCDIPNYRKEEIQKEFDDAFSQEDDIRATELQCGLVSVEFAIKDYIERYAYPIKVRGLLETFEDILKDVRGFSSGCAADLEDRMKLLGEKENERKKVSKAKESVQEKIDALENAKEKTRIQLGKLDKIKFDNDTLKKAISDFRADIEEDDDVKFLRKHKKVNIGRKTRGTVEKEINERINRIVGVYNSALNKINVQLERIRTKHDRQLSEIFDVLNIGIIKELENAGVFKHDEYCFKDSVFWKKNFEGIKADVYADEIKKSIVEGYEKSENVPNYKKLKWAASWNPFKRWLASWLLSDTKSELRYKNGYYETEGYVQMLDSYLYELDKGGNRLEKLFKNLLDKSKKKVCDLSEELLKEVGQFQNDIKTQKERIQSLSNHAEELQAEIDKITATNEWLGNLVKKIEGV